MKRRFGAGAADDAGAVPFNGGAAVIAGTVAAVFADATGALGSAVDLAARHGASELFFFCEHNTGATARRAGEFRLRVSVIDPDGDFAALEPALVAPVEAVPVELDSAAARMRSAGLDVEWEHDVLRGEWLGLEVARAFVVDDGPQFEVGVGKHDRAANRELYPGGPPDAFLDQTVARVRELRCAGAPPHPANQLASERWLRSVARRRPGLVGLGDLRAGPTPTQRVDLRQRAVAPTWVDDGGVPTVVVFSAGVDPDLLAQAADARLQASGWLGFPLRSSDACPLVIVVPEGDDHPLTRRLVEELRRPARVHTVPAEWRTLDGRSAAEP